MAVIGLLAAHLLCVNLASGGPIVGTWLDWQGTRGDALAAEAAARIARWSVAALLLGSLLGVALGWIRWDAEYRDLWLGPLSYKMHWAVVELVFSFGLTTAWWRWLPGKPGTGRGATVARGFVALLAATNLLYHFPTLFAVAAHLQRRGYEAEARIGGAAFRQLMSVGEIPALAVHVALASIAVAGAAVVGFALRGTAADGPQAAERLARCGAWWALGPSLLQLPVGLWTLATLPADSQMRVMGADSYGVLIFIGAMGAALWLISDLAHVAFGETTRSRLWRVVVAMAVTVLLMTAMHQRARGPFGAASRAEKPFLMLQDGSELWHAGVADGHEA